MTENDKLLKARALIYLFGILMSFALYYSLPVYNYQSPLSVWQYFFQSEDYKVLLNKQNTSLDWILLQK